MILTDSNIELYSIKYYINTNCIDRDEFNEDYNRFKYVKRLVRKYVQSGDLRERLILNHLVILFNTFESKACVRILYFKMKEYFHILKPFLILMNRMPETIKDENNEIIHTSDIPMDELVITAIRENIL